jgi:hypothetical protein
MAQLAYFGHQAVTPVGPASLALTYGTVPSRLAVSPSAEGAPA